MVAGHRDLIGEWFSALEAHGEHTTFRLGRYGAGMSEPDWFFLPHEKYDGLGGLAHVLRTVFGTDIDLPRSSEIAPSRWARVFAALYCLRPRHRRPMRWRHEDPSFRPASAADSAPSALAWALLSKAETESVRAAARGCGVSLNAWLLWTLSRASLPRLVPCSGDLQWIVPVNMRGAAAVRTETENAAWNLDVAFAPDATPERVHAALRRQMDKEAHWGAWELLSWLRYFSVATLMTFARREMQVRKHGSFSNLGRLEPAGAPPSSDREEWWMAFNPVLRSRPVGAACLTWRGRLALTLQLHPALSRDPREARAWLDTWHAAARGDTE